MSASTAEVRSGALASGAQPRTIDRLRAYFASDPKRTIQTVLGAIWLLDGGLQFQSFMYSHAFIASLLANLPGQATWIVKSITWATNIASPHLGIFNTLFALTQVAIGLGLLYRRTAKHALLLSFGWVLVVWWFGEAFGMIFMQMPAAPLSGAPGGVLLYAIAGLLAWPTGRPGGLLGVRGARIMWAALWLFMAYLWLEPTGASRGGVYSVIQAAPSGMSWLSSVQDGFANVAKGNGIAIALVLAAVSAVIGLGVACNWRPKQLLIAAIVLNLVYWVVGQGFGGIFAGGATDPNAAPLFILLAYALYTLTPYQLTPTVADAREAPNV